MAILKSVGTSKAPVSKGIDYITQEVKTKDNLIATHNCMIETAKIEMMMNKNIHNKEQGVQYYHYVVSFNPEDDLTPERANEIGTEYMKNIEKWKDHKVVMATHTDKDHIHNHYIIDSVNMESGLKYQRSPKELEQMKEQLRELSKKHDLTIPEKSQEIGNISQDHDKYRAIERAEQGKYKSYVYDTYKAVKDSQEKTSSKDEFIKSMNDKGYDVNWTDRRKHITFKDENNKRVRLANLEKTFNDTSLTKEKLLEKTQEVTQEQTPEKAQEIEEIKQTDRPIDLDSIREVYDKTNETIVFQDIELSSAIIELEEIREEIRELKSENDSIGGFKMENKRLQEKIDSFNIIDKVFKQAEIKAVEKKQAQVKAKIQKIESKLEPNKEKIKKLKSEEMVVREKIDNISDTKNELISKSKEIEEDYKYHRVLNQLKGEDVDKEPMELEKEVNKSEEVRFTLDDLSKRANKRRNQENKIISKEDRQAIYKRLPDKYKEQFIEQKIGIREQEEINKNKNISRGRIR